MQNTTIKGRRIAISVMFTLAGILAWIPLAHAEPLAAHKLFKDLLFGGCLPSVATGTPVEAYARQAQMSYARPELAAVFLAGKSGNVYIRPDPQTPMVITQLSDGTCTVAARTAPDLPALVAVVEQMLIGPGSTFKHIKSTGGSAGATMTSHEYQGVIGQRSFGVLLSTDPTQGKLAQAMATVFKR